jgi:hypothetical protein
VNRAEVQRLLSTVELDRTTGEDGLLAGEVDITVELAGGQNMRTRLAQPPGAPARAPSPAEFDGKLAACGPDVPALLADATWASVGELLRWTFPAAKEL